jgi:hypothetical protein
MGDAIDEAAKARVAEMFGQMASTYDSAVGLFDVFGRRLVVAAAVGSGDHVLA